jgi:hypothetical protein
MSRSDAWTGAYATRWRLRTAGIVGVYSLGMAIAVPDPVRRSELSYAFVTALGYGHLLGAVVFSRAGRPPAGWIAECLRASALVTLFALYSRLLAVWPRAWILLLGLSVWHTAENDLCLSRAYSSGAVGAGLRLPPLPSRLRDHAPAVVLAVLLLALSIAAAERSDVLAEIFVASTLYHLVSWLLFLADRSRAFRRGGRADEARRLERRLVGVHAPGLALSLLLAPFPGEPAASLHDLLFAPGAYLFWAALHVLQTARVRSPRGPAARLYPTTAGSTSTPTGQ